MRWQGMKKQCGPECGVCAQAMRPQSSGNGSAWSACALYRRQSAVGNRDEVVVFEYVFVHAELAGAAKVHSYVRSDNLFYLPDSVIVRMWTIIDQLAFPEGLLAPGAPVKRGDHREQVQSIWQGFVQGSFPELFSRKVWHAQDLRQLSTGYSDYVRKVLSSPRKALDRSIR